MSERVNVEYWRAPVRLLNLVRLAIGGLGLHVHHCGNRLVVHHVSALKDIESVLVL
jgi:hypothetical protein